MKKISTKQWLRVFFILALISLLGILWQWQNNFSTTVKVSGGSFTEGIIGTPRFINPVLARPGVEKDLTQLVFGSLITKNAKDEYVFNLADSLDVSEDGKTYILKLKDNLFFHDGQTIDADDFIFTLEKIQDPIIKSPLKGRWEGVVDIKKIDNLTIELTLDQAYSDFIDNFNIGIIPQHVWKDIKSDEFIFSIYNSEPIGSGNYFVKKINFKNSGIPNSYLLEKAKESTAYISKIKLSFFENETELIQAYRDGKIDTLYGPSANQDNRDLFDNEFATTGKLPKIFGLFLNQNKQKLLADKNIRSLINAAIDRQSIIDEIFAGYAYPITGPLGGFVPSKKELSYYQQKLENEGWLKNERGILTKKINDVETPLSINLSTPNTDELISLSQVLKKDLYQYGIELNIKIFDEGSLHQKVIRPRDYEILLFGYMIEKDTDLYAFWHSSQKSDPGLNISLYSNKSIDKQLESLRKTKNSIDLESFEKEIMNDVPAIFIYSPAYTYLLPKKIKGEQIFITEKNDRFAHIEDWYINTRKVWNFFIKK